MAQDLRFLVGPGADYERPEEDAGAPDLVTRFAADLADGTTGVYVGFLATRPGAGSTRPTPGATWDRLVEVNDRYDPTNQFRHNQNTRPPCH